MKFLRRLCSEQVQILLERMDNHWEEEFAIDGSKWEPMLPHGNAFEYFTAIEKKCIRDTVKLQTVKMKKERAYAGILERTMSPTKTRWEFQDEKYGRTVAQQAQPAQMLTNAAMRKQMEGMLNQQFQKTYTGTLQEHAQYERAKQRVTQLQQHMEHVNYELSRANSPEELQVLMQKHQFLMEHEKSAVEHYEYLRKHAPKGYM